MLEIIPPCIDSLYLQRNDLWRLPVLERGVSPGKRRMKKTQFSLVHGSVLQPNALDDGAKQIRFPHKLVEQTFPLDQLGWRIEFGNFSVVEHHYAVRIQDGVDAVSNGDNGSVLEHVAAQCHL
jgi:hypothetical protein